MVPFISYTIFVYAFCLFHFSYISIKYIIFLYFIFVCDFVLYFFSYIYCPDLFVLFVKRHMDLCCTEVFVDHKTDLLKLLKRKSVISMLKWKMSVTMITIFHVFFNFLQFFRCSRNLIIVACCHTNLYIYIGLLEKLIWIVVPEEGILSPAQIHIGIT